MGLPLYLAMTAAEFTACSSLPARPAWMACHFSPYGTGLSNIPKKLPRDAMLILNDRTPIHGHDPKTIVQQLQGLECSSLLLDFQRKDSSQTMAVAKAILEGLDCLVGVSELYGKDLDCPVFLPPVPPGTSVEACLAPWQGREIWLEAALDSLRYTVTAEGSAAAPPDRLPEAGLRDESLHCHYHIDLHKDSVDFTLFRTREDLAALLEAAGSIGVTRAVGLYQELGE